MNRQALNSPVHRSRTSNPGWLVPGRRETTFRSSTSLGFYFRPGSGYLTSNVKPVPAEFENQLATLKEKLLTMASHAEAAVNRAIKALIRRDDDLARRTKEEDSVIDRLEMEIDEGALALLCQKPGPFELRLITMAMKIAHD